MSGYKIKFNGLDRLHNHFYADMNAAANSAWISGKAILGEHTHALEQRMAKKYSRQYAVSVGSATDGLYFAMRAAGVTSWHTVFCPALSYVATAGAVRRIGSNIKFIDTDTNGNMGEFGDENKPNAMVYANLFGNPADYDRIKSYCESNKIILIEDAAQSQGACYRDVPSGKMGDVSVFSFDPMKNMPSFGSGGMVFTDDKDIYERVISLRRHAINSTDFDYGYNSVISEDHAAQLLVLLDHYDQLQEDRKRVSMRYYRNLSNSIFIRGDEKNKSSYHKLVMLDDDRDALKLHLDAENIETKIHYAETLDTAGSYPVAENLCSKAISLPIYPFLHDDEIDYVCEKVKDFHGI